MPRREQPLDHDGGLLSQFAVGLRRLRKDAGSPTYRELGQRAHYSASTLSDAAGGKKLPSLAVTLGYVRACGGDVVAWERRWHDTAVTLAAEACPHSDGADGDHVESPYVGLTVFQPGDAARFFGRDRGVDELAGRLAQQRFLAVFGPSGSGKSSLLRAGLLPRLRASTAQSREVLFTPGSRPLEECAVQLAVLTGATAAQLYTELRADARNLHLAIRQALAGAAEDELIMIIDQFEEVFTLCTDQEERTGFFDAVLTAVAADGGRCRIVVGVRADFYAHCARHPDLAAALTDAQVLLGPMTAGELRDAIVQPAVRAGYSVEGELVAQLVAEVEGQAGVLPALSHALRETWRRRSGNRLTLAGYQATGGIAGGLARTAEQLYETMDAAQQRAARQLLLRLTAIGDGTEDTKRRIPRDELDPTDPDLDVVLDRLVDARLITLGATFVDLAHESLIRAWPRLRGWLATDRDGRRIHRHIADAAGFWEAEARDPGGLLRGARLVVAYAWSQDPDHGLTPRELQFLEASREAEAREHTQQRRRNRQLRWLVAALIVLLVTVSAVAVVAVQQREHTLAQERILSSRQMATEALALYTNHDTGPAVRLGLAAYSVAPTDEARDALLSAAGSKEVRITSDPASQGDVAIQPGGHIAAAVNLIGIVSLWQIPQIRLLATFTTDTSAQASLAFSPDGHLLTVSEAIHSTRLFDVSNPRSPTELSSVPNDGAPAFSPDGALLTGHPSHEGATTGIWEITRPRQPREVTGLPEKPEALTLGSAGTMFIRKTGNRGYQVWNHTSQPPSSGTSELPRTLGEISAVSRDGQTLITRSDSDISDQRYYLWDTRDIFHPLRITQLPVAPGGNRPKFSDDGTLVLFSSFNTVQLIDISDRKAPRTTATLTTQSFPKSVAFGESRHQLTSVDINNRITAWELNPKIVAEHAQNAN
ncbi:XRE family transcriptional regulator [Amycolatopsis sp. NPDC004625]|uniref:nSTAND1 domain-containing NTPase n=1 Tax=Amycolatopsis sp. NPDC004625 TaxID=3154670 RepID=UPI0033A0E94C